MLIFNDFSPLYTALFTLFGDKNPQNKIYFYEQLGLLLPMHDQNVNKENIKIAEKWFLAFNVKDISGLLMLYNEEAIHYSPKLKIRQPETEGLIKGKQALYNWWADAFKRLPALQYIPTTYTANDLRIIMEYIRKVDGEHDMLIAEVLEIKDGLIIASRVYHG